MFNRILLALSLVLFARQGVQARDDRIVVLHPNNTNFCSSWSTACKTYSPVNSTILSSTCEPGDFKGANTANTSKVICSVGTGAKGQLTLITQFVANKEGAKPKTGKPQDAC